MPETNWAFLRQLLGPEELSERELRIDFRKSKRGALLGLSHRERLELSKTAGVVDIEAVLSGGESLHDFGHISC